MDEIKMRVSGVEKSFPGVKALSGIDFAVRKGTVHALCGENGAGKSTLMKIIMGLYQADKGQIYLDEKPCSAWREFWLWQSPVPSHRRRCRRPSPQPRAAR